MLRSQDARSILKAIQVKCIEFYEKSRKSTPQNGKKKERKKNNQGKYSQRDGMKDKGMIDLR